MMRVVVCCLSRVYGVRCALFVVGLLLVVIVFVCCVCRCVCGCLMLLVVVVVVSCFLVVGCCLMFICIHCLWLLVVCCSACGARCLSFVICCLTFDVSWVVCIVL